MTEEEYRSIPEHDTIEVSRDGKVRYKDGKNMRLEVFILETIIDGM